MIKVKHKTKDSGLMERPCVTIDINGKVIKEITEIHLKERTTAKPSLMFQVKGGLRSEDLHFYDEPDLRVVYENLKLELSEHGIKFINVLLD